MSETTILLPGKTVPKQRPRFNRKTGTTYTDPGYREWLDAAAWEAKSQWLGTVIDTPVAVQFDVTKEGLTMKIEPMSRKRPAGLTGDLDNLIGSGMDALQQGGVLANDSLVLYAVASLGVPWR